MAQILPQAFTHVNNVSQSSCNDLSTLALSKLPPRLFNEVNLLRRAWIKAATIESKLRLNEPRVLEAIVFNCDPISGIGDPSIGTIKEFFLDMGWGEISYSAISQNIQRIKAKGSLIVVNRFEETNVYQMVGYKLANHSFDSHYNLILTRSEKRDLNITHYAEYESHFANIGSQGITTPKSPHLAHNLDLKSRKSENSEITKSESSEIGIPKKLMKSEWEVRNQPLEEILSEIVEKEIPENQKAEAATTLKRINAPLDTKLELLKEVGQLAKVMIIVNIGGLLVSRYKQLEERMKNGNSKTHVSKDIFMDSLRLRQAAEIETERRLRVRGIIDPILQPGSTYEELGRYRSEHGTLYPIVLRELSQQQCSDPEPSISPKRTWADVAYS
jgi:hypothetical protein